MKEINNGEKIAQGFVMGGSPVMWSHTMVKRQQCEFGAKVWLLGRDRTSYIENI